jgi:TRAP-type mannitol/chloroaromatic compound transport system substrate-binding protein
LLLEDQTIVTPPKTRRSFLAAAAGALAATGAGAQGPAVQSGGNVRWRCASAFPKSLDLMYGALETVARLVNMASNGRFQIALFPEGEIASMPQLVDQVQVGTVDCVHTFPAYYFGKDEVFALDGAVPFGLTSRQMNAWVSEGNGQKLLRDFYRGYNIVNFPLGNTGAQLGGWYRKEVRTVADLKCAAPASLAAWGCA